MPHTVVAVPAQQLAHGERIAVEDAVFVVQTMVGTRRHPLPLEARPPTPVEPPTRGSNPCLDIVTHKPIEEVALQIVEEVSVGIVDERAEVAAGTQHTTEVVEGVLHAWRVMDTSKTRHVVEGAVDECRSVEDGDMAKFHVVESGLPGPAASVVEGSLARVDADDVFGAEGCEKHGLLAGPTTAVENRLATKEGVRVDTKHGIDRSPVALVTLIVSRVEGRRVELTRAVIHIESVEHRMLGDGIGYVSINNFQGNTHEDLQRALADLHGQELKGLVLDLRDNPGGLLDQAVRIADTFLSSGTIVRTSSPDERQRDEKFARPEGTEPDYPMVVLINGSSASASEIVAGALKNHDRALVIGQRSFGKGSVQVLQNFQDGSALKLTIAQYLTPGDVSIQGVGIVPDIGIDPMTVDEEDMDLDIDPESYLREADLQSHLTNQNARDSGRPSVVLRYYLNREMRQQLREADPRDTENEEEDEFLTRFAKQLLTHATHSERPQMLTDAASVITEVRDSEMARAVADLRRLGVDWSVGEDQGASPVAVEISTTPEGGTARAGEPFGLKVRVTNNGEAPLFRLRAVTDSDYRLFDDRELVFGRLNPGETREWTTTLGVCVSDEDERRECRLPRDIPDRADGIRVTFQEEHGHAPEPVEVRTTVQALDRPQFAYSVHVADDIEGNGDGFLQRGEKASLYLRVKNVGQGQSFETHANLRNLAGRGIVLTAGRFRIDDIAPGQEKVVRFTFEVLEDFERLLL